MIGFVADADVTIASFAPKWYISMDIKSYYAAIVSEQQTQFRLVRPGLTKVPGTVSIMSVEKPGRFLRHNGVILYWQLITNPLNRRSFLAKPRPSPSEPMPSLMASQPSSPSTIGPTTLHSTTDDSYTCAGFKTTTYSKREPASPSLGQPVTITQVPDN